MPSYHVEIQPGDAAAAASSGAGAVTTLNAPSLPGLVQRLESEGYTLRGMRTPVPDRSLRGYWQVIGEGEFTTFLRQLAVTLENGVSLAAALGTLARESQNPTLRAVILDLERSVRNGDSLSSALTTYPRLFSPVHVRLLEAGEAGHRLPEVLRQLAEYAELAGKAAIRIRTALIYPQVVGVFSLVVLGATFMFVGPKFIQLYEELGVQELPFATQVLTWFMTNVAPILVAALPVLGLIGWIFWVSGSRQAPFLMARIRTRIPLFGALYHNFALLRLTRLLAALLAGGVPVLEALRLAGQGAESPLLQAAMWDAIPHVADGESLATAFGHANILPPSFCSQIAAAEATGDLPGALARLGDWYADRVDYMAARIGALAEPIFIVLLALLTGWVIFGLFAPLVGVIRALSGG